MDADATRVTRPLREMLTQLEDVTDRAGDRFSEFWEDAAIRRRFSDAVDAIDDARLAVLRRVRGEPATTPLQDMTVQELHDLAAEREIPGRSSMNKAELVDSLRKG